MFVIAAPFIALAASHRAANRTSDSGNHRAVGGSGDLPIPAPIARAMPDAAKAERQIYMACL
jgi:hypothetical protein